MSAFLGPIHFIMYEKIQLQNKLLDNIIIYGKEVGVNNISEEITNKYGENETAPLESVIDHSAIHNWLNNQVIIVEKRMAYGVKLILDKDKSYLTKIGEIFFAQGEEKRLECADIIVVDELFKFLNMNLLDGMPCDGGVTVQNMDGSEVIWEVNLETHEPYYQESGLDIETFLYLRDMWLKGFFKGSFNIEYSRISNNTFRIIEV